MLAVDGAGRQFDGDEIVALAALHLRESGELPGGTAVTVMSNYGFHQAMEAAGIEVATTKVGDRFVIEELLERGWTIGGEQSGHIIWTDFAATGDGIAAALLIMRALSGRTLAEARPIEKLPQRLENVRIREPRRPGRGHGRLGGRRPRGREARRAVAACWFVPPAPSRSSGSWSRRPTRPSASRCSPDSSASRATHSADRGRPSACPG